MSQGRLKILTPHKIYLERIKKECCRRQIGLARARCILGIVFRIPKQNIATVFAEMQQMGLIMINGQRFVHVLEDADGN